MRSDLPNARFSSVMFASNTLKHILEHIGKKGITNGLTHFAISVGSKDADEKDITYKFDLLDKWKLHYYE